MFLHICRQSADRIGQTLSRITRGTFPKPDEIVCHTPMNSRNSVVSDKLTSLRASADKPIGMNASEMHVLPHTIMMWYMSEYFDRAGIGNGPLFWFTNIGTSPDTNDLRAILLMLIMTVQSYVCWTKGMRARSHLTHNCRSLIRYWPRKSDMRLCPHAQIR